MDENERLTVSLTLNKELTEYVKKKANYFEISPEKFVKDCISTDMVFNDIGEDPMKEIKEWIKEYKGQRKKQNDLNVANNLNKKAYEILVDLPEE